MGSEDGTPIEIDFEYAIRGEEKGESENDARDEQMEGNDMGRRGEKTHILEGYED